MKIGIIKLLFVCLLESQNHRESYKEIQRNRSSIFWFTPKMASMARAGLVQIWEPEVSKSSMRIQGLKDLGYPLLFSEDLSEN